MNNRALAIYKSVLEAMQDALEGNTTPEPPKGWVAPAW